jgi:5-bromo-4-chloroindolyl phosphate hydrolysis protein
MKGLCLESNLLLSEFFMALNYILKIFLLEIKISIEYNIGNRFESTDYEIGSKNAKKCFMKQEGLYGPYTVELRTSINNSTDG